MIVVGLVGLLAAIAIPNYQRARERAFITRYAADLQVATAAFIQYSVEQGRYPRDVTPAIVPPGMADYLKRVQWTEQTVIGGEWDWDYKQFGCTAGVSVYQPTVPISTLTKLDSLVDDGDLATGGFRSRANGYIQIIEF